MANPAEALNEILHQWVNPPKTQIFLHRQMNGTDSADVFKQHRQAILLIHQLETILASMERTEQRAKAQGRMLTRLTKWVLAYPHDWQGLPRDNSLGDQDLLDYLESMAGLIGDRVPKYTEPQRAKFSERLNEVIEALKTDASIPAHLRNHLHMLVNEARSNLDTYEITGDFAVQSAMERLAAMVIVAENASSEKSKWAKFRTNLLYPTIAGIAAAVPQVAIAAAAGGA